MKLPKLPPRYTRKEAKITPKVMKWFMAHYPEDVALEVKIDGNKTLPHQDLALNLVHKGKFAYKIPDMGARNPFDVVVLKKAKAFVVTCNGRVCEAVGRHGEIFTFKV